MDRQKEGSQSAPEPIRDGDQALLIAENGCITPCPHTQRCGTYGIGCTGECYWCQRYGK